MIHTRLASEQFLELRDFILIPAFFVVATCKKPQILSPCYNLIKGLASDDCYYIVFICKSDMLIPQRMCLWVIKVSAKRHQMAYHSRHALAIALFRHEGMDKLLTRKVLKKG